MKHLPSDLRSAVRECADATRSPFSLLAQAHARACGRAPRPHRLRVAALKWVARACRCGAQGFDAVRRTLASVMQWLGARSVTRHLDPSVVGVAKGSTVEEAQLHGEGPVVLGASRARRRAAARGRPAR